MSRQLHDAKQPTNPNQPMKATRKPLSYFRHMKRHGVAKLDGLKSIMRAETARTVSWWLVLPARGDSDAVCVLIRKAPKWELIPNVEAQVLSEYAARISD